MQQGSGPEAEAPLLTVLHVMPKTVAQEAGQLWAGVPGRCMVPAC